MAVTRIIEPTFRRTFTGAWIETVAINDVSVTRPGRTFTGAWIETLDNVRHTLNRARRTFTGAWIET